MTELLAKEVAKAIRAEATIASRKGVAIEGNKDLVMEHRQGESEVHSTCPV